MTQQKKIVIIAGPIGGGETTIGREFLPFDADCHSQLIDDGSNS